MIEEEPPKNQNNDGRIPSLGGQSDDAVTKTNAVKTMNKNSLKLRLERGSENLEEPFFMNFI